jgi:hypothetical protein
MIEHELFRSNKVPDLISDIASVWKTVERRIQLLQARFLWHPDGPRGRRLIGQYQETGWPVSTKQPRSNVKGRDKDVVEMKGCEEEDTILKKKQKIDHQ